MIYNVLLKSRLQQKTGESEAEFELRRMELAAKNKSGRSTAQRQLPESDEEIQARLAAWYSRDEAFAAELTKLPAMDAACIVVEADLDAVLRGRHTA